MRTKPIYWNMLLPVTLFPFDLDAGESDLCKMLVSGTRCLFLCIPSRAHVLTLLSFKGKSQLCMGYVILFVFVDL